jgi:hypothetical protein
VPHVYPPDVSTTAPIAARRTSRASGAPRTRRATWAVPALFTLTAFVGAGLLFTIQPLVARLLLPAYGGSATVWSTCSLFFQVLLLAGYVYSHVTTTRIPRRLQPWIHGLVLLVPLLVLPLALPADAVPAGDASPVGWLLRTLVVMIGLPFVVLSTTGPLLQRWYSWSDGPRADDPYFLFAASNVGSFGGLLAYPFLIEPHFSLQMQRFGFTWGFILFALLTVACGVCSTLGARPDPANLAGEGQSHPRPSVTTLVRWSAYAFVPSCVMLAVTHHISTDVAPIPLLWIAPLAIYLATFVAAFAVRSFSVPAAWPRAAAGAGLAMTIVAPIATGLPLWLTVGLDMALVAVVGYAAHRLLAADRPSPEHLTTFYLAVAVGGALGGVVNGLVAPLAFDRVLEYPVLVALLPLVALGARRVAGTVVRVPVLLRTLRATALGLTATAIVVVAPGLVVESLRWGAGVVLLALGLIGLIGWGLARKPAAMSLGLLAAVILMIVMNDAGVVLRDRTFYGSYTVRSNADQVDLSHGTTLHGLQLRQESLRDEPTTYYGRNAPLGDLITELDPRRIVAVGLGVGTLAAYGEEGDTISFLEIDPAVADIAEDPRYFSFLSDSDADVDVRIGDGRLLMEGLPDEGYDLVVLDAFSSDAIPVHLLTQEAFTLYADRVAAGGAIAVHVSNRHFDLVPVVAAARAHLGWAGAVGRGGEGIGVRPSTWVVLSPERALVDALLPSERWEPLDLGNTVEWTDDYSSILTVLR